MGAVVANWQLSFLRREHERIAGTLPASRVRWQCSRDVRLLVLAIGCVLLHRVWVSRRPPWSATSPSSAQP
jgi:hypothetical protein